MAGTVFSGFGTAANSSTVNNIGPIRISSGTYTDIFVAAADGIYVGFATAPSTSFTIDNISVKEVLFDQGDLTLFNHPADVPRIEYDADGNVLGLLVEESRTNLVTYSEDFTQPVWAKSAAGTGSIPVVTSNYAVAPDGTNSASRIQMNAGSGTTSGDYSLMRFTVSSAPTTLINSLWIKSNTESSQTVKLSYGASDAVHTATTEWQRFDIVSGNPNFADVVIRGDQTVSSVDLLIWGYQAEAGAFPTSYIPTDGATATRSADVASIPVADFGYNKTNVVGTFYVEFSTPFAAISGVAGRGLSVTSALGTGDRTLDCASQNGTAIDVYSNHTISALYNLTPYVSDGFNKVAATMKENDSAACNNGGTVVTDTTTTVPIDAVYFNIGKYSTSYTNGHIKSIRYYPRRLTDAQLQELTT